MKTSSLEIIRQIQWKVPEDIGLQLQKVLDDESEPIAAIPAHPTVAASTEKETISSHHVGDKHELMRATTPVASKENIPDRIRQAHDRIIGYGKTDSVGINPEYSRFLMNELLDVWDHHSFGPTPSPSQAEPQQGEREEIMRRLSIGYEDGFYYAPAEPQPIEADSLPEIIEKVANLKDTPSIAQPQQPALSFEEWWKETTASDTSDPVTAVGKMAKKRAYAAWQASAKQSPKESEEDRCKHGVWKADLCYQCEDEKQPQEEMDLPPWIKFPCPTCGAKAGHLCENKFGNASCMYRVLLADDKQSPKIEWPEALVSDEWLASNIAFYGAKGNWEHYENITRSLRELQSYRKIREKMEGEE